MNPKDIKGRTEEVEAVPKPAAECVAERLKGFRSEQAEDAISQLSEVLAAVEAHGTADEQDWVLREMTRMANHARFEISKRLMAEIVRQGGQEQPLAP